MRLWLKACPKCQGDLFLERDLYGGYIKCFQCGRELTFSEVRSLLWSGAPDKGHEEKLASLGRPRKAA